MKLGENYEPTFRLELILQSSRVRHRLDKLLTTIISQTLLEMSFVVFVLSSRPVLLTIQLKLKHNFARGEYTTICATWGQILSTELIMYKKLMLLSIDFQYWFLINWQTWNEAWPIRHRSSTTKQNQNCLSSTISQLYNWRWEVGGACGDSFEKGFQVGSPAQWNVHGWHFEMLIAKSNWAYLGVKFWEGERGQRQLPLVKVPESVSLGHLL